jgi:hypothetical protein
LRADRALGGEGSYGAPAKGETIMKAFWIFRIVFVAASLVFIPASFPAHAQGEHHTMTANVPFAFEMGSKHLAPGVYTITTLAQGVVEVKSNSDVAIIMANQGLSGKPTKTAKVVFDRCGDRYFLRQLWFNAEENSYLENPESKSEKQAKRSELASNSKQPSNVELAMLRLP